MVLSIKDENIAEFFLSKKIRLILLLYTIHLQKKKVKYWKQKI